jgi:MFS family permease
LIGGYGMGFLADKIGRRPALILSAVLAAAFIWRGRHGTLVRICSTILALESRTVT